MLHHWRLNMKCQENSTSILGGSRTCRPELFWRTFQVVTTIVFQYMCSGENMVYVIRSSILQRESLQWVSKFY